MRESASETALVIFVPGADDLVGSFRRGHDPSAAAGCAAHITLLYPFRLAAEIDQSVEDGLRDVFADTPAFTFSLTDFGRFHGVLYLRPEPEEPFRALTQAIWARHPETPPYGGRFTEIVPHLTVAHAADENEIDAIASEVAALVSGRLPMAARADTVGLIERRQGRWRLRQAFSLKTS